MANDANGGDSELGRSRASVAPSDHLYHLLTVGWNTASPLIQRYVAEHSLQRELSQWQAIQAETAQRHAQAGKTGKK